MKNTSVRDQKIIMEDETRDFFVDTHEPRKTLILTRIFQHKRNCIALNVNTRSGNLFNIRSKYRLQ